MFGFGAFEGFFFIGQNEARCWKKRICSVVTFNSAAATQKSIYLAFVESCESVALPSYTIQIIASFADDVLVHDVNPFILFYVRHTQSYCRWRRIYIHIYIRMLFFFPSSLPSNGLPLILSLPLSVSPWLSQKFQLHLPHTFCFYSLFFFSFGFHFVFRSASGGSPVLPAKRIWFSNDMDLQFFFSLPLFFSFHYFRCISGGLFCSRILVAVAAKVNPVKVRSRYKLCRRYYCANTVTIQMTSRCVPCTVCNDLAPWLPFLRLLFLFLFRLRCAPEHFSATSNNIFLQKTRNDVVIRCR